MIENGVQGHLFAEDLIAGGGALAQTLTDLQITNSVHRKVIMSALIKVK